MKKFEALAGGVIWITLALTMAAAALEPVPLKADTPDRPSATSVAMCADGSAMLAMGCESIHL
jgi:hypothetical protein